jgi:adenylosuccinate lyase
MTGRLSGGQWQEGDVSCSVVRRVALPDAFFAIDGLIEAFLTVLNEFGPYPAVIERELNRYLPFLAVTKLLMAAVKKGVNREDAYAVIQEHAKAVALDMRQHGLEHNNLYCRLGEDRRLELDQSEIETLVGEPVEFIGDAVAQVASFYHRVVDIVDLHTVAAAYQPGDIL